MGIWQKSEFKTFYSAKFIVLQDSSATVDQFGKKLRAQARNQSEVNSDPGSTR